MSATDFVSTPEYDAFGPWILEVTDAAQVPRAFATYPIDFDSAHTVVKVPRNIARRDATPQMDLYDHLLIVGSDHLTVLGREDGRYSVLTLGYGQIAALRDSVNLLDGRLTIYALDGSVVVLPYNGASRGMVGGILSTIRAEVRRSRPARAGSLSSRPSLPPMNLDDLGRKDAVFVTTTRELTREEPGLRLIAATGRSIVRPRGGAGVQFTHVLDPATLHALVVLAGDDEVQILTRRDAITRKGAPVVSMARLVVPLATVSSVESFEHPGYLGVVVLRITAGSAVIDVAVPQNSLTETVLRAL